MDTEIVRSNRKSIELNICRDGHIRVRVPFSVTDAEIAQVLKEKSSWIEKHRKQMLESQQSVREMWGNRLSAQDIQALADQAVKIIPEKVRYFAGKIGVDYGRITIRNQKTGWGSCSGKGNLNFNWQLVLIPEELVDYVVVHELCHLTHMDHSKAFWALVESVCPDYRTHRKWLKEHGQRLIL